MKILLIEDDIKVSEYIINGLKEAGHNVDSSRDGKDGLFLATTEIYDVIIVDRMLPSVDGLTIIQTMRASDNKTPVIILSALGDVDDRVKGLKSGSDDYLVKPFAFVELMARIDALSRRTAGCSGKNLTVLKARGIELDLLSRKVRVNDKEVDIQGREFNLLEYLMRNKGNVVTRTMLLEGVWDYNFDPQTNVIDVHVSRVRKKIGDDGGKIIRTVRGAGYIIE
ncbi:MAG: response regulator transcription factor [Rickettsiales bacterium]|nr:response regulator transcription factor [Pseudomonadota bacterium]MDA0966207.1 response regulator transcription factor [Pseudomonadota bacterium]MDG4543128.1 response regulator transcription factor [Rickettsiales bacterium]MDG4545326.1 response regulator transcription factor [Rickettsiales bacterium]MDG4547775.1 response regulator transcription factor [Rickettsiales bacterium]